MKLRLGLVGLGEAWQVRHAPALRALTERFRVCAIHEAVAHRAEQAAAEFDACAIDGYHALIRREDIDAILVLAPQWYGPLPILAACESGKAIYCAGGLELSVEEARHVKRRVVESGIAFVAEFPRRHAPATIRLKELIATRIGQPRILFCHQRSPAPRANHHAQGRNGGAPSLRDLLELVDWCCYVVDKPPAMVTGLIHKTPRRSGPPREDYHMMSLDFSDPEKPGMGPVAQISCGRYIPAHWQEAITYRPLAGLQVSCARGVAFIDLPQTLIWFDEAGRHQEVLDSERPVGEQLLTQFYRAVTSLVRHTNDLEDACRAQIIVQQARQSHEQGRRMLLGESVAESG
jgi:predicted dehydrogenase